jgi:hypothetical protein
VRRWRLQFSPGSTGCAICGAKDKGDLVSPAFPSFGNLWCIACMYIGGKLELTNRGIETLRKRGHLQSSMEAFSIRGLRIERNAA